MLQEERSGFGHLHFRSMLRHQASSFVKTVCWEPHSSDGSLTLPSSTSRRVISRNASLPYLSWHELLRLVTVLLARQARHQAQPLCQLRCGSTLLSLTHNILVLSILGILGSQNIVQNWEARIWAICRSSDRMKCALSDRLPGTDPETVFFHFLLPKVMLLLPNDATFL